jgi:hypothetical protein
MDLDGHYYGSEHLLKILCHGKNKVNMWLRHGRGLQFRDQFRGGWVYDILTLLRGSLSKKRWLNYLVTTRLVLWRRALLR